MVGVLSAPARRVLVPFAVLLGLATLVGPTASAGTTTKTYTATLTGSVGAGTEASFAVTITNTTSPQTLGSANFTVASAFVVRSSPAPAISDPDSTTATVTQDAANSNLLKLRNLSLATNHTATVTFTAEASCFPTDPPGYASTIRAKQSNDFSGTGNDFLLNGTDLVGSLPTQVAGQCQLSFVTQPNNAAKDANITSVQGQPAGAPVRVEVLDADGADRVTAAAGSTATVSTSIAAGPSGATLYMIPNGSAHVTPPTATAIAGLATFAAFDATHPHLAIDKTGVDYRLGAGSSGMTSGVSNSTGLTGKPGFDVFDSITPCNPPQCHGNATGPSFKTQVDVSNGATANDQILLAYGFTTIDCAGYTEVASDSVTIDYTGVGTKTVTDTISAATMGSRTASSIEVCFGSPNPFPVKPGTTLTQVGSLYVGLLPKCNNTATNPPCVIGSPKKNGDGSVTVKYQLASGDPIGRH